MALAERIRSIGSIGAYLQHSGVNMCRYTILYIHTPPKVGGSGIFFHSPVVPFFWLSYSVYGIYTCSAVASHVHGMLYVVYRIHRIPSIIFQPSCLRHALAVYSTLYANACSLDLVHWITILDYYSAVLLFSESDH